MQLETEVATGAVIIAIHLFTAPGIRIRLPASMPHDTVVDQRNSLLFYQALIDKKIPASLPIFPQGGYARRNNLGSTQQWTIVCETWL